MQLVAWRSPLTAGGTVLPTLLSPNSSAWADERMVTG